MFIVQSDEGIIFSWGKGKSEHLSDIFITRWIAHSTKYIISKFK